MYKNGCISLEKVNFVYSMARNIDSGRIYIYKDIYMYIRSHHLSLRLKLAMEVLKKKNTCIYTYV